MNEAKEETKTEGVSYVIQYGTDGKLLVDC